LKPLRVDVVPVRRFEISNGYSPFSIMTPNGKKVASTAKAHYTHFSIISVMNSAIYPVKLSIEKLFVTKFEQ
jgi:hypothetical protein